MRNRGKNYEGNKVIHYLIKDAKKITMNTHTRLYIPLISSIYTVYLKLMFSAVWLLFVVAVFWRSAASSPLDAILLVRQIATTCGHNLEDIIRLLSARITYV